jgi:hypothetical protein
LLEQRIREAEEIIMGRHFAGCTGSAGARPVEPPALVSNTTLKGTCTRRCLKEL